MNDSDLKHLNLFKYPVVSAVNIFQNHSNILKIKSNQTYQGFSFRLVNYEEVFGEFIYVKNNSIRGNFKRLY